MVAIIFSPTVESAKMILVQPKYEIIMVPSNQSFFQYCDSNIGLFLISPCRVITLNPLCILFGISSFLMGLFLKLSLFQPSRLKLFLYFGCTNILLVKYICKNKNMVGENIIAIIKIRNNHGTIQSLKFPILR